MKEIVLNGELVLNFPESFRELSEEERNNLNFLREGEGVCLSDPEHHILASLAWQQLNGFSAMMLSAKDIAGNAEKSVRAAMQAMQYQHEDASPVVLDGETGQGFSYTYEVQGIAMFGRSVILKKGKTVYYLHFYARAGETDSRAQISEILASAKLK